MKKVGYEQAMEIAHKMSTKFIYDMAQLEGNTATYEEVETIAAGRSVGGLSVREVNQVYGIARGWNRMLDFLKDGNFEVSKEVAVLLNMNISSGENYNGFGDFRVRPVRISGTDYMPPRPDELEILWNEMIDGIEKAPDDEKALYLYLESSRNQYFGDGNKRTALTMMNAMLIEEGYCPITITLEDNKEYRSKLLDFYERYDPVSRKNLYEFFKKCQDKVYEYWVVEPERKAQQEKEREKEISTAKTKTAPKKIQLKVYKPKSNKGMSR